MCSFADLQAAIVTLACSAAIGADGDALVLSAASLAASGAGRVQIDTQGAVSVSSLPCGFDRLHMAMPLADGYLLVADTWNNRLQRVSPKGEAMVWPVSGTEIPCPVAVDEDGNGRILVTAWGSSRLLLFGKDGRRLELGEIPDLNKPYDARFYRDGFVVADSHNGRVLVFDKLIVDDPASTMS